MDGVGREKCDARKFVKPVTLDDARRFLDRVLVPLWKVMPSAALYHRAFDVARYRHSLFDSLVVAAALDADARRCTARTSTTGSESGG